MKIYKTQSEVEADIKNEVLAIDGDVKFECSISISASIIVNAGNISALNITAWDITAGNISAWDISAGDISARNISAGNISALDINAGDILYYTFCCVYQSIKCFSIKARRDVNQPPICLEGKLEIKPREDDEVQKAIQLLESKGRIKDGKIIV